MNNKKHRPYLEINIFSARNSRIILWSFTAVYIFLYLAEKIKIVETPVIDFFIHNYGEISLWSLIITYIVAIKPYGGNLWRYIVWYFKNILDLTSRTKDGVNQVSSKNKTLELIPIVVLNVAIILYIFGDAKFEPIFEGALSIATFALCFLFSAEILQKHGHFPLQAYLIARERKKAAKLEKKLKNQND